MGWGPFSETLAPRQGATLRNAEGPRIAPTCQTVVGLLRRQALLRIARCQADDVFTATVMRLVRINTGSASGSFVSGRVARFHLAPKMTGNVPGKTGQTRCRPHQRRMMPVGVSVTWLVPATFTAAATPECAICQGQFRIVALRLPASGQSRAFARPDFCNRGSSA